MNKLKYIIENWIFDIKMEYQRIVYGMSEEEIWTFDEKVAMDIKRACFILACDSHGFPDMKGMTADKWKQILLDISFGFGSYLEMRSGVYEFKDKEFKSLKKEYENGLKLFSKYHEYIWD